MTCPSPEKVPHRNFRAAIKARDALEAEKGIDIALRPYRCGDHWHLGHKQKLNQLERRYSTRGTK